MALNEKEFLIISAKIMFKQDWKLALSWLTGKGYTIKKDIYYRTLNALDKKARTRINDIAKNFEVIVADEIEKFRIIEKQLYEEYHKEEAPINRAKILKIIAEMQPYITSLYDEVKMIFEDKIVDAVKEDTVLSKSR